MGSLLVIIGSIVFFVGWIWIIIEAFKTSILWGLGTLIVPIVGLIFVLMNWEDGKKPFLIYLAGIALMVVGVILSPHGQTVVVTSP